VRSARGEVEEGRIFLSPLFPLHHPGPSALFPPEYSNTGYGLSLIPAYHFRRQIFPLKIAGVIARDILFVQLLLMAKRKQAC
jgi:hypothetical protein